MNTTPVSLKDEITHVLESCKYITDMDLTTWRAHDCMQSLIRKHQKVEADITTMEPNMIIIEHDRDTLLRKKGYIDILISHKSILAQMRKSAQWLVEQYPESSTMTLMQLLDFIDVKKSEIKEQHTSLHHKIREQATIISKYNRLIQRRDHLQKRIDDLERTFIDHMEISSQIRRDSGILASLAKISDGIKD